MPTSAQEKRQGLMRALPYYIRLVIVGYFQATGSRSLNFKADDQPPKWRKITVPARNRRAIDLRPTDYLSASFHGRYPAGSAYAIARSPKLGTKALRSR
jgi:hypothetical protein